MNDDTVSSEIYNRDVELLHSKLATERTRAEAAERELELSKVGRMKTTHKVFIILVGVVFIVALVASSFLSTAKPEKPDEDFSTYMIIKPW